MKEIINILKKGNIVIPLFLIENIKKLDVNMNEFVFLMYLYNLGNKFLFDPAKFMDDLNLDLKTVMNYIGILTDKHFIRVEVIKNDKGIMEEAVLLDDFYDRLSFITIDRDDNNSSNDSSDIFEIIEKEFGRTLSPIEYEIIKAWFDNGFNKDLIKEAVKEATFNGVSNLRYIDKILYEWNKNGIKSIEDVEKNRKKRNKDNIKEEEVDLDIVDWDWFDDE